MSDAFGRLLLNSRCAIAFSSKSFRFDLSFDMEVHDPGLAASDRWARLACPIAGASGISLDIRST